MNKPRRHRRSKSNEIGSFNVALGLLTSYEGRLFVCSDQSGRTSAPTKPHAVHTILGHNDRTGISSGSQSAFMMAL
jgi:hypothetical protein